MKNNVRVLFYRAAAKIPAGTILAEFATPHIIKLVADRIHNGEIVRKNSGFEVSFVCALRSNPGTGQIRRANLT